MHHTLQNGGASSVTLEDLNSSFFTLSTVDRSVSSRDVDSEASTHITVQRNEITHFNKRGTSCVSVVGKTTYNGNKTTPNDGGIKFHCDNLKQFDDENCVTVKKEENQDCDKVIKLNVPCSVTKKKNIKNNAEIKFSSDHCCVLPGFKAVFNALLSENNCSIYITNCTTDLECNKNNRHYLHIDCKTCKNNIIFDPLEQKLFQVIQNEEKGIVSQNIQHYSQENATLPNKTENVHKECSANSKNPVQNGTSKVMCIKPTVSDKCTDNTNNSFKLGESSCHKEGYSENIYDSKQHLEHTKSVTKVRACSVVLERVDITKYKTALKERSTVCDYKAGNYLNKPVRAPYCKNISSQKTTDYNRNLTAKYHRGRTSKGNENRSSLSTSSQKTLTDWWLENHFSDDSYINKEFGSISELGSISEFGSIFESTVKSNQNMTRKRNVRNMTRKRNVKKRKLEKINDTSSLSEDELLISLLNKLN